MPINTGDRVLAVGKTGSGKTYLSARLLKNVNRLMILDHKGTLSDWVPPRPLKEKVQFWKQPPRLRLVPPIGTGTLPFYDHAFQLAYGLGDTCVYIDELYAAAPPGKNPPNWLSTLYTRGRERGVGVWACTQRPSWVPLFVLSESDHFFVFRLHLAEDRKRLAGVIGDQVLEPIPDQYGFWYYNIQEDHPVYFPSIDEVYDLGGSIDSSND